MNAELLIDEIFAVLDGEHEIVDNAAGVADLEVFSCYGGGGGGPGC